VSSAIGIASDDHELDNVSRVLNDLFDDPLATGEEDDHSASNDEEETCEGKDDNKFGRGVVKLYHIPKTGSDALDKLGEEGSGALDNLGEEGECALDNVGEGIGNSFNDSLG